MRLTLLTSTAALGFALALPAFAQTATDPNPANPSAVQDGTPAAGTGSGAAPGMDPAASGKTGATLGNQAPSQGPGPLGVQANPGPSSGQTSESTAGAPPAAGTNPSGTDAASPASSGDTTDQAAPAPRHRSMSSNSGAMGGSGHWAHQPGTGESGPASARASNIDSADTHSVIAPHLPSPGVGQNAGPERYLQVAEHALREHKTGEAQQALEMAETRLLDRSTAPSAANQPDESPRIAEVTAARKALAAKDWEGARRDIREAMNRGGMASGGGMSGGMASDSATGGSGGMATGASATGTSSGGMASGGGVGTTSSMAPNSTNQGVAGGNAGATPAPMDPSAQGPATAGAAGSPTPGASVTPPNPVNPGGGSK
jgi:hypothetical protein